MYRDLLIDTNLESSYDIVKVLLSHTSKLLGADLSMKNNLTRKCIETLAIQSAYHFCVSIGIKPSLLNLSMVTGFSEEIGRAHV